MAKTLPKVDITKLTAAEIDGLSQSALRDALRSVIRDPNIAASHKDHRSHSSIADQVLGGAVSNPNPVLTNPVKPVLTNPVKPVLTKPGGKSGGGGR